MILWACLQVLNETYFKLDSEEATHCDHCHLICCVYIKGHVSICVNTHCLMLEVLRYIAYIALNAFNCVHTKIKAMSKVLKICHRFQYIKFYVCQRRQRWCLQLLCNTAYRVTHFVAHVEGVEDVKYYE